MTRNRQIRRRARAFAEQLESRRLMATGLISFADIQTGSTLSGIVDLSIGSGLPSGTASVQYSVDGIPQSGPVSVAPYDFVWNSATKFDGPGFLSAVALDASGDELAETPNLPIVVNNHPGQIVSNLAITSTPSVQNGLLTFDGLFTVCPAPDRSFADNEVVFAVDGVKVGQRWGNATGSWSGRTLNLSFDVSMFPNGAHTLSAVVYTVYGGNNIPVGSLAVPITINNGHTPAGFHAIDRLFVQPGSTGVLSPILSYTDGVETPLIGGVSFQSADPSVATVDADGNVHGVSLGATTVTMTGGGFTYTSSVQVTDGKSFAQFTKDGRIIQQYDPTESTFVRSMIFLDPTAVKSIPGLGDQVVAAGITALETNIYTNPAHLPFTSFAAWQKFFDTNYNTVVSTAQKYGLGLTLTGDDIARTAVELSNSVVTNPWAAQAIQYAFQKFRDSGIAISVNMVDEVNMLWGNDPTPTGGAWASKGIPDDAFTKLMSIINGVDGHTPIAWPVLGASKPSAVAAWSANPDFSNFASIFWANNVSPSDFSGLSNYEVMRQMKARLQSLWPTLDPSMPQVVLDYTSGRTVSGDPGSVAYRPGQGIPTTPGTTPTQVASEIMFSAIEGMAGVREYAYDWVYWESARMKGSNQAQAGADPFETGTDRWQAMSSAFNLISEIEPYLLQPQVTAPDLGTSILTGARQGPDSRLVMAQNVTSAEKTFTVDLGPYAYGKGGNIVVYRLNGASLTTQILSGGSLQTITLQPGESISWVMRDPASAASGSDITPPAIALASPLDNATIGDSVTLAATASDNVKIDHVTFFVDGKAVGTVTAAPFAMDYATAGLAPGIWHSISVVAYDSAGNTSQSRVMVWHAKSQTAPVLQSTNLVLAPSFNVSDLFGSYSPSGDHGVILLQRKPTGSPDSAYVTVDSRVGAGVLTDSTYGAYGNVSYRYVQLDAGTEEVGVSAPLSFIRSQVAVATPAMPILDPNDDSGTLLDHTTMVNSNLQFNLSGVPAGYTVRFLREGAVVENLNNVAGGSVTLVDPSVLSDGTYRYSVVFVDPNGNAGLTSSPYTLVVDISAPRATNSPALDSVSDTGRYNNDRITGAKTLNFKVTSYEAGSTIQLFRDGQLVQASPADPSGTTVLQDLTFSPDGIHNYQARQIDAAGNPGTMSSARIVTIDRQAPAAPTLALDPSSDKGILGDSTTTVRNPYISGHAEPLALVELFDPTLNRIVGSALADSQGFYKIQVPTVPGPGRYLFAVRATDLAGNLGSLGDPMSLKIVGIVGDYTNSGVADVATYSPSGSGNWSVASLSGTTLTVRPFSTTYVQVSSTLPVGGNFQLSSNTSDIPVQGDFDGDGRSDFAVYRPSTGEFLIQLASGSFRDVVVGSKTTDMPVPGDYDGDGITDPAVFSPDTGLWTIQTSTTGRWTGSLGLPGDIPVPADYDGDGKVDLATYRPSASEFLVLNSSTGTNSVVTLGDGLLDVPVPADYDGDGKVDMAVYRPSTGLWQYINSSNGNPATFADPQHQRGDIPIPADYDGDGKADFAVYQSATATVRIGKSSGGTRAMTVGSVGNIPAAAPSSYALADGISVPLSPNSPVLDSVSDTGRFSNDQVTAATTLKLRVSGYAAGSMIQLFRNGQLVQSEQADLSGTTLFEDSTNLPDGVYSYQARQIDAAKTVGPLSSVGLVTIDHTGPSAPTLALDPSSDTGILGDSTTTVRNPYISGHAEPDTVVELIDPTLNRIVGSALADSQGFYKIQVPTVPGLGQYLFAVRATDLAGNVGALSRPLALNVVGIASVSVNDVATYRGLDGSTTMLFTLSLNAAAASSISVTASTSNVTAVAGVDYQAKSEVLTFAPGETRKQFAVTIYGTSKLSADKVFYVHLSNSNATLGRATGAGIEKYGTGQAIAPAVASPPAVAPTLSLNDVAMYRGLDGSTTMLFTLSLNAAAASSISVTASTTTLGGLATAIAGVDYQAKSEVLTFAPGETRKQFAVTIYGTSKLSADKIFYVNLANTDAATSHGVGAGILKYGA